MSYKFFVLMFIFFLFTLHAEDKFDENAIGTVFIRFPYDGGHASYHYDNRYIGAHRRDFACDIENFSPCHFDLILFKEGSVLKSIKKEISSLQAVIQKQSRLIPLIYEMRDKFCAEIKQSEEEIVKLTEVQKSLWKELNFLKKTIHLQKERIEYLERQIGL